VLKTTCILIAGIAHLLLAATIWFLFPFLQGGRVPDASSADLPWCWIDLALLVQFCVLHSLLLRPAVRESLERWIPSQVYGCCYTIVTCCSLLLLVFQWRVCPVVFFRVEGWASTAVGAAYILSWVGLFYSLGLNGYGYQTGWTPFWGWLRHGKSPRRRFEVKGAYHWLRHPVYLCFLGLAWFTPLVTADRLLLTLLLTGYIFLGSYFKDRRLQYFLGETYGAYQARVPGYPFFVGPLGRVGISKKEQVTHAS
jgi:methanethiol S-methyltransferase